MTASRAGRLPGFEPRSANTLILALTSTKVSLNWRSNGNAVYHEDKR